MFGPEARWEHEWTSVYTFTCRMMQRFVHGRVIFAGDAAHVVSPFGARGGNGAIADVDNLAWKLALVVRRRGAARRCSTATAASAARRRARTSCNSTRSTDFITPKFPASRAFRDAALTLAPRLPVRPRPDQQRPAVGADGAARIRRSTRPTATATGSAVRGRGGRCSMRRLGNGWLIDRLGRDFSLLTFGNDDVGTVPSGATAVPIAGNGLAWQRYDAGPARPT